MAELVTLSGDSSPRLGDFGISEGAAALITLIVSIASTTTGVAMSIATQARARKEAAAASVANAQVAAHEELAAFQQAIEARDQAYDEEIAKMQKSQSGKINLPTISPNILKYGSIGIGGILLAKKLFGGGK